MRRVVPLVALFLVAAGALWYQQTASRNRGTFPAPDFVARDLEGRSHRLSDLRGKVVFLNLWATWCAPCREEMPSMELLQRDMGGEDFVILAVSEDAAGAEAVKPFVAEFGFTFPILLSPNGEVGRKFGITGYPETYIIDRSGRVAWHYVGPLNWADTRVRAMLRSFVDAPVTPAA